MKPHAYRRPFLLRASVGVWLLALYLLSEVER
jgi:hypothetical protein